MKHSQHWMFLEISRFLGTQVSYLSGIVYLFLKNFQKINADQNAWFWLFFLIFFPYFQKIEYWFLRWTKLLSNECIMYTLGEGSKKRGNQLFCNLPPEVVVASKLWSLVTVELSKTEVGDRRSLLEALTGSIQQFVLTYFDFIGFPLFLYSKYVDTI